MDNTHWILSIDLDILATLDSSVYSNLNHYRSKTTVFRHLTAILQLFQSRSKPVLTMNGKAYFLFSHDLIKKWSKKEEKIGGSNDVWQSHKIFLMDLGLIETYKVVGPDENPVLNRIWEKAKREKKHCETLWTIPLYDDGILRRAESIAGLYHEYGISVAHLRKNVIIRFRGQKRANWLYADWRIIGDPEKIMLTYCHEAIKIAISEKGYTTFKEMETRVCAMYKGREYYQQRLAELLYPKEADIRDTYTTALNFILEEKTLLCRETGCIYRQIRKTDRKELKLPKDLKCWIIVPETSGSSVPAPFSEC